MYPTSKVTSCLCRLLEYLRLGCPSMLWISSADRYLCSAECWGCKHSCFYLQKRHKACVLRVSFYLTIRNKRIEDSRDFIHVTLTQTVLVAVLYEITARVNHDDAVALVGVLLVDNNNAGWNARAVEKVYGQTDDTFDKATVDEWLAYSSFGVSAEEYVCGRITAALPLRFRDLMMWSSSHAKSPFFRGGRSP